MDEVMKRLGGPRWWWRRWWEGQYGFRRESDGLYAVVYAKDLEEAYERAAQAYEHHDGTPGWLRGFELGSEVGDSVVVGVNYRDQTVDLEDPEGVRTTIECPQ